MSEGPPKKNHVFPPGPEGKRMHYAEVLKLSDKDRGNVRKIKAARAALLMEHHADKGGSHEHGLVINAAADEAIARAEGRWDEKKNKEIPKVTLDSLREEELSAQVRLNEERKRQNPDPLRIAAEESTLRVIAAKRAQLEREAARASAADEHAQEERRKAGEREREEAEAAKERERLARVEAARKREEEEAAASEQPEINDQAPEEAQIEAEDTQPKEEELVATGTHVVPYVERDSEVQPQGEVIDHPIEPSGTHLVTTQESAEEEAAREPGTAVVVAESSSSGDIVPASAETPVQGGEVVPYEEDEYFPLAAAGGGGEGGGGDDEDAAHDHPEGHGPHHAHGHNAHHGDHHGHGDHGHGSHDSGHGAGSHGHAEEKKKGLFGAWWSFFGSLFAFGGETIKGFGTFFGKGGGGGGGGESHGH